MSPRTSRWDLLSRAGRALAAVQDRVLADMATGHGLAAVRIRDVGRAVTGEVDALFGPGFTLSTWLAHKQNAVLEVARTAQKRGLVEPAVGRQALWQLTEDTEFLLAVFEDVDHDVNRVIESGRPLSDEAAEWLANREQVAVEALGLQVMINEALEASITLDVFTWVHRVRAAWRGMVVEDLRKLLHDLHRAMVSARQRVHDETAKAAFNVGINVLTLLYPPVGIAGRIGVELGTHAVNSVLSAKPTEDQALTEIIKKAQDQALTEIIKEQLKQMERIDELSGRNEKIHKNGQHVLTVMGFVFDVHSVGKAIERVEEIAKLMEKTRRRLAEAQARLHGARVMLESMLVVADRYETETLPLRENIAVTRRRLESLRREYGYNPHNYP